MDWSFPAAGVEFRLLPLLKAFLGAPFDTLDALTAEQAKAFMARVAFLPGVILDTFAGDGPMALLTIESLVAQLQRSDGDPELRTWTALRQGRMQSRTVTPVPDDGDAVGVLAIAVECLAAVLSRSIRFVPVIPVVAGAFRPLNHMVLTLMPSTSPVGSTYRFVRHEHALLLLTAMSVTPTGMDDGRLEASVMSAIGKLSSDAARLLAESVRDGADAWVAAVRRLDPSGALRQPEVARTPAAPMSNAEVELHFFKHCPGEAVIDRVVHNIFISSNEAAPIKRNLSDDAVAFVKRPRVVAAIAEFAAAAGVKDHEIQPEPVPSDITDQRVVNKTVVENAVVKYFALQDAAEAASRRGAEPPPSAPVAAPAAPPAALVAPLGSRTVAFSSGTAGASGVPGALSSSAMGLDASPATFSIVAPGATDEESGGGQLPATLMANASGAIRTIHSEIEKPSVSCDDVAMAVHNANLDSLYRLLARPVSAGYAAGTDGGKLKSIKKAMIEAASQYAKRDSQPHPGAPGVLLADDSSRKLLKGQFFTCGPHIVSFLPAHASLSAFLTSLHTHASDKFHPTLMRFAAVMDILLNVGAALAVKQLVKMWAEREDGGHSFGWTKVHRGLSLAWVLWRYEQLYSRRGLQHAWGS